MGEHSEVFVAFDVAKKKHAVAMAEGGRTGEVRFLGDVENSPLPIERTIKRLAQRYDHLHVCFEAGPTGYGLYRQVKALGHDCMVVAPALIPKRSGERIKRRPLDACAPALARRPEVRARRPADRLSGRDRCNRRCASEIASPGEATGHHRAGVVHGARRGGLPGDARRFVPGCRDLRGGNW